MLLKSTIARWR